jgi:hypothetical protein
VRRTAAWSVSLAFAMAVAGCGEDRDGGVDATTASAGPSVQPTTPVEVSAPVLDETAAQVLAAAAKYRATERNSFSEDDYFTTLHVVERLGRTGADGFVSFPEAAPAITDGERDAIEAALAPRTVIWVHSLDAVIGTEPPLTIPDRQAVLMLAEPILDGRRAEVGTMLWCGMVCGIGGTLVLEYNASGNWVVTDELGGFVA